jgi:hypothetical protein
MAKFTLVWLSGARAAGAPEAAGVPLGGTAVEAATAGGALVGAAAAAPLGALVAELLVLGAAGEPVAHAPRRKARPIIEAAHP